MSKFKNVYEVLKKEALSTDGETFEVSVGDTKLTCKKRLSLTEMIGFVVNVHEICFDSETAEYLPHGYDFAIRIQVLEKYLGMDGAGDSDELYSMAYGLGDLFDQIYTGIDTDQFEAMMDAIGAKIKYTNELTVGVIARSMSDTAIDEEMLVEAIHAQMKKEAVQGGDENKD